MRSDFHKVLTEDPRRGGEQYRQSRRRKGNTAFDEDGAGGKQSMMQVRRQAGGRRKQFGDHLNPLRRWLETQVGRPWNKVYSELCEKCDQRSFTKEHVHLHVFRDMLQDNVVMVDGVAHVRYRWSGLHSIKTFKRKVLYVNPNTGLLCQHVPKNVSRAREDEKRKRAQQIAQVFQKVDDTTHLIKEKDGIWRVFHVMQRKTRTVYVKPHTMGWAEWAALTPDQCKQVGVPQEEFVSVMDHTPNINDKERWAIRHLVPDLNTKHYYGKKVGAPAKLLKKYGLVNAPA